MMSKMGPLGSTHLCFHSRQQDTSLHYETLNRWLMHAYGFLSGCEEVENCTLQLVEPCNFLSSYSLATPLSYTNFTSQPHKY